MKAHKFFFTKEKDWKNSKQTINHHSQCFVHSTEKERDKTSTHFETQFRDSKRGNSFIDHRHRKNLKKLTHVIMGKYIKSKC